MRVLHAAAEIAGQPALLCRGLRDLGVEARSLAFGSTWARYPSDITIDGRGWLGLYRRVAALLEHGTRIDILHVHFGTSFLPRQIDLPWLQRRGVRLVFHFHGCDVRPRDATLQRHRIAACSECPVYCSPRKQERLKQLAASIGAVSIVSTPDLLEAVPGAVHLPVAIDVGRWTELRERAAAMRDDRFVVLHAPSDPHIKGTRHVERAVGELAERRPGVVFTRVQGVPAAAAAELYSEATVVVDQLHMGWHGLFAVEAMLLGKPVLVYVRPELRDYRPTLPVIPTHRRTLADDLERLFDDPDARQRHGRAGIDYATREHGLERVAARLKRIYEERVLEAAAR